MPRRVSQFLAKAMAQAMAYGFENPKPRPWAKVSQAHGLALAWLILLGLARLLASRPSRHITSCGRFFLEFLTLVRVIAFDHIRRAFVDYV